MRISDKTPFLFILAQITHLSNRIFYPNLNVSVIMIDLQTVLTYLTLISVPIGVLYHIMTLNNQSRNQKLTLENRNAQLLMTIYDKYTETELLRQQINILSKEWKDIDDFWDNYGPSSNPEFYTQFSRLAYYFDGIGVLVRRELVEKDAIYDLMGAHILQYWNIVYGPLMTGLREKWNNPDAYLQFEYLVKEMEKLLSDR